MFLFGTRSLRLSRKALSHPLQVGVLSHPEWMGIPGFGAWFHREFKSAYLPNDLRRVDHVYVDTAGYLHTAHRTGNSPVPAAQHLQI